MECTATVPIYDSNLRFQFTTYIEKFQVRQAQTTVLKGNAQSLEKETFGL